MCHLATNSFHSFDKVLQKHPKNKKLSFYALFELKVDRKYFPIMMFGALIEEKGIKL